MLYFSFDVFLTIYLLPACPLTILNIIFCTLHWTFVHSVQSNIFRKSSRKLSVPSEPSKLIICLIVQLSFQMSLNILSDQNL